MTRSGVTQVAIGMLAALLMQPLKGFVQPIRVDGLLVEFPEQDPVDLGIGWNTRTGNKVSNVCIDFQALQRQYQDKRLTFEVVNDNESLANALKVSVAAKFKTVIGASGSAAASFARSTKFSSASTHIAVLAEVFESPSYVAPVTGVPPNVAVATAAPKNSRVNLTDFYRGNSVSLKPDLRTLAADNREEFYRQCGDSFVAVIHRGARLVGNMAFAETTSEERQQIEASASGGTSIWSVEGSLSSSLERYNSANRLTINFAQFGGSGGNFPLNREGLLDAIRKLPQDASQFPRPFTMIVQRYDSLPGWPGPFGATELTDLETLASVAWRLDSMLFYADEALYRPGWLLKFDTTRVKVQSVYDDVLRERTALRADAIRCKDEGVCNLQKWGTWSDIGYRVRLPFRGTLADLAYKPSADALDEMVRLLAAARTQYWIETPNRWRCRNELVCLTQADINRNRSQIEQQIRQSLIGAGS